ncbi:hypothetical protein SAMN05421788_107263 [Filimonas lacunae]|uniref:Uncharacterized protein n=1 Tax=Filimonas lacunae TaxID=477680 RepID=A0A173MG52_9BACT|nr:hypothetical protein [Filimonas lacunae]BAV06602.1 hypothetical protein FLA_2621 [Filimonas lacunae]SIT27543.1 hypothetical protein SAMN05421788_107263 [Filimonas lacunae]
MDNPVSVHIEELVLHGFHPADKKRIGVAVQKELTRLFRVQGIPPAFYNGGSVPAWQAAATTLTPGMPPRKAGRQIAQSVYAGFNSSTP